MGQEQADETAYISARLRQAAADIADESMKQLLLDAAEFIDNQESTIEALRHESK